MATRELSSPPSMRTLYPKAAAGLGMAGVRRLPGLGGARELPDTELVLPDVEVDRGHLAAYDRLCGFRLSDELPPTYPHLIAFPLGLELMTDRSFPFPAIGLVHVRNRIEQARPPRADERLTVRVRAEDMRPHDRGTQFDVVAEVEAGGEAPWRSRSTYLHREGGSSGDGKRDGGGETPKPGAIWRVAGDVGRRYADVSGDRNPIHLRAMTARLFGMKRHIAHGMWLKARCLGAIEDALRGAYSVDVSFKLPVFLPGKVAFASWREDGGRAFALHDAKGEKPHLSGVVEPA